VKNKASEYLELDIWVKSEKRFLLFISLFCFSCILYERILFFCLLRELQALLIVGTSCKLTPAED